MKLLPAVFLVFAQVLAAEPVEVRIISPPPDQPAFNVVVIRAEVQAGDAVAEVAFAVDGRVFARVRRAPYEASADLGPENTEHTIAVLATTVSGAAGRAEMTTPKLHVDQEMVVELRQLYVSVHRDGANVLDLHQQDFSVVDNGSPQHLITFARGDVPFTAVLLVDSSISMRGARLRVGVDGARAFAAGMRPLDEGKLMVFSDRLLHTTPFTGDGSLLLVGLESVVARGGTAVNDNLFLALALLEARQGRRVVILLSDGADTDSVLAMDDVIRKVRESRALVYWIRVEPDDAPTLRGALVSPWHDGPWYQRQLRLLEEAADVTGGRILRLGRAEQVPQAIAEVVRELREQYVLGYYPSGLRHNGGWRKVKVNVDRGPVEGAGFRVQVRDGYVDE
ncbi:MAG TPA: VWA domain-containing protein [Thermoanaerobaculaceae bacterium]|nr:VWA domain-containing protein [Thermoanaerobaculaceae bacterium]